MFNLQGALLYKHLNCVQRGIMQLITITGVFKYTDTHALGRLLAGAPLPLASSFVHTLCRPQDRHPLF